MIMTKTIEILIPTAEPKVKEISINHRVHDLNGKVLGFLWNEKPNGDVLLERLREDISRKYKLARTDWGQVKGLHVGLEETLEVKQMATAVDAVVIAVGD